MGYEKVRWQQTGRTRCYHRINCRNFLFPPAGDYFRAVHWYSHRRTNLKGYHASIKRFQIGIWIILWISSGNGIKICRFRSNYLLLYNASIYLLETLYPSYSTLLSLFLSGLLVSTIYLNVPSFYQCIVQRLNGISGILLVVHLYKSITLRFSCSSVSYNSNVYNIPIRYEKP